MCKAYNTLLWKKKGIFHFYYSYGSKLCKMLKSIFRSEKELFRFTGHFQGKEKALYFVPIKIMENFILARGTEFNWKLYFLRSSKRHKYGRAYFSPKRGRRISTINQIRELNCDVGSTDGEKFECVCICVSFGSPYL